MVDIKTINDDEIRHLLNVEESHFIDLKGKDLSPAKFSKAVSAFANASGGEIFLGIEESQSLSGKIRTWSGFLNPEEANSFFQILQKLDPIGKDFKCEFLKCDSASGIVLHVLVSKTQHIVEATDGKIYFRRNAQSLPLPIEDIEKLKLDKGIFSYEDSILNYVNISEITNSEKIIDFLIDVVPTGEPELWLSKQFVLIDEKPTVAGVLLFSDNPQSILPKRSSVKILRYQTKSEAERDFLASTPETIEGPLYDLIYDSVDRVKKIIEGIEKLGPSGLKAVSYPEEALHELLTNAILHRDYSIAADIQVRIFDNRVEIESPGKLPGHITVENIARSQFSRNPKIVRLINKFQNPPNKDVGEGVNTAFEAMSKLRLKRPEFKETEQSVIVTLRHESLASPEQLVMEYLKDHEEITNQIARDITGIKSENTMKNVFYRLRNNGQIEQCPKVLGKKHAWRKRQTNTLSTDP